MSRPADFWESVCVIALELRTSPAESCLATAPNVDRAAGAECDDFGRPSILAPSCRGPTYFETEVSTARQERSMAETESTAAVIPPPAPDADELRDLGFGRVLAQQTRGRFIQKDGSPNTRKFGLGAQRWERFYRLSQSVSWPVFL